jgi:hypothetical protein
MTDVKAVVNDLLSQLEAAKAAVADIDKRRAEISLAALGDGDADAKRKLAQLHKERATAVAELEDITAAITAARQRAVAALEAETANEERERATRAKPIVQRLEARGAKMDEAIKVYRENFAAIKDDLNELARLGAPTPSRYLVEVNTHRAHDAALTPLGDTFVRPVAPTQRRTFAFLLNGWALPARNWVDSKLKTKPAAEAA